PGAGSPGLRRRNPATAADHCTAARVGTARATCLLRGFEMGRAPLPTLRCRSPDERKRHPGNAFPDCASAIRLRAEKSTSQILHIPLRLGACEAEHELGCSSF